MKRPEVVLSGISLLLWGFVLYSEQCLSLPLIQYLKKGDPDIQVQVFRSDPVRKTTRTSLSTLAEKTAYKCAIILVLALHVFPGWVTLGGYRWSQPQSLLDTGL